LVDYVNDHDHFRRAAEGDPLARQGEGVGSYACKGETNSRFEALKLVRALHALSLP